ncbi:SIS domain-containing protein [Tessaracoccus sp. HDW20]|uniref:SIS domain-containing protein n=1 Tax=Tessaracoccus coleopterorum TaxID=2714950 RepID=UPI0018D45551|nr:SIS domain-containing protein [Tessaracoccus coleopterorum]
MQAARRGSPPRSSPIPCAASRGRPSSCPGRGHSRWLGRRPERQRGCHGVAGGKTAELLPIIDVVKQKGAKLIALTENPESTLAQAADVLVTMTVTRESDPLNVMATTSNTVTGALLDALLAGVMELTGYRIEQFALIHPGGAVGARLNQKA